jgi:hypothetical protein
MGGELRMGFGNVAKGKQYNTDSLGNRREIGTTSASSIGTSIMCNVGMIALRKRGLVVMPILGAGYGISGMRLRADNPTRIYPLISGVVTETENNLQNIFIWYGSPSFDFGISTMYYFGRSTEDNAKGISLGFRFGYNMQLATSNIKINQNKKVEDSPRWVSNKPVIPSVGSQGFYFKVSLGFGRVGENL